MYEYTKILSFSLVERLKFGQNDVHFAKKNFFLNFRINDRVISANNVSLEGVDYATAVQVLRDSGQTVDLVVKRRVVLPPSLPAPNAMDQTKLFNVHLQRLKKKEDFGIVLGKPLYYIYISKF